MIKFTLLGEPASKSNSRELVTFGGKVVKDGDGKVVRNAEGKAVRAGGRPSLIKSEKARNYEREATLQIPNSAKVMLQGDLRITLHVYYASERPDLDESVVLDVLQTKFDGPRKNGVIIRRGVYINDRQVREKHVYHAIDKLNPRTEIEVEALEVELFEPVPYVKRDFKPLDAIKQKAVPSRAPTVAEIDPSTAPPPF